MRRTLSFLFLSAFTSASAAIPPAPAPEGLRPIAVARAVTNSPADRIFVDYHTKLDLRVQPGIQFDFYCADLAAFSCFNVYFKSGKGWYCTSFAPERQGVWERIRILRRNVHRMEGTAEGWGEISCVRVAAWHGGKVSAETAVVNLSVLDGVPRAAIVSADSCSAKRPREKDDFLKYAGAVADACDTLGYSATVVSDFDVTPETLKGMELVVLPYNPSVPPSASEAIRDYMAKGGKIFVLYALSGFAGEALGLKSLGTVRAEKKYGRNFWGFVKTDRGLPGQPDFSEQNSWATTVVAPSSSAKILAKWAPKAGNAYEEPGLVETPTGIFMGHVWLGATPAAHQLLRAIIEELAPASKPVFASAQKAREAREKAQLAYIRSLPPKKGEFRAAWCHSAWGLGCDHDWDSSVKFLTDNGFTDLIANLAWGGMAFYKSDVLPQAPACATRGDAFDQALAACRKYGAKLHVWKVCWRMNQGCTGEYRAQMKAAGRTQVTFKGEDDTDWFCPSHPANLKAEIDAMVELARKGADGVHFDYIRYPDRNGCFCGRCRRLFEEKIGGRVANWPADVRKDKTLAEKWDAFRAANITAAVKGAAEAIHGKYPAKISAAVFRDAERDVQSVGQDWSLWCREGWLDFVCPMDYTPSAALHRAVLNRQKAHVGRAKFYPGVGLSCWPEDGREAFRLAEQIAGLRALGIEGFTVFNFDRRAEAAFPIVREGPLRD